MQIFWNFQQFFHPILLNFLQISTNFNWILQISENFWKFLQISINAVEVINVEFSLSLVFQKFFCKFLVNFAYFHWIFSKNPQKRRKSQISRKFYWALSNFLQIAANLIDFSAIFSKNLLKFANFLQILPIFSWILQISIDFC